MDSYILRLLGHAKHNAELDLEKIDLKEVIRVLKFIQGDARAVLDQAHSEIDAAYRRQSWQREEERAALVRLLPKLTSA